MPPRSRQRCCENTELDMSQEQESASPSADHIYASVDCINNDVLDPQVDPKWAKDVHNSWNCTKPYIKIKPTFEIYNCPEKC